jgi:hypothetical protein
MHILLSASNFLSMSVLASMARMIVCMLNWCKQYYIWVMLPHLAFFIIPAAKRHDWGNNPAGPSLLYYRGCQKRRILVVILPGLAFSGAVNKPSSCLWLAVSNMPVMPWPDPTLGFMLPSLIPVSYQSHTSLKLSLKPSLKLACYGETHFAYIKRENQF